MFNIYSNSHVVNQGRRCQTVNMPPLQVSDLAEVSNDGKIRVVTKRDDLLVDHKSEDTHHGGAAVVQLNGTLGELGLLIKVIPAEVDVAVTEVSDELVSGSRNITHEAALKEADEGDDLDKSGGGDGVGADEGGDTVGERVEGVSRVVDVSAEVDSATGDDLSKEGKLGDTSVLDLDCEKERGERKKLERARINGRRRVPR